MVTNPPIGPDGREVEMVGVDCCIIMNPKVWKPVARERVYR